jgi:hypothetical protein
MSERLTTFCAGCVPEPDRGIHRLGAPCLALGTICAPVPVDTPSRVLVLSDRYIKEKKKGQREREKEREE